MPRRGNSIPWACGVTAAQLEGAATREIYDLLLANGVELGKRDYLGQIQ
jgi:hypothetical protein